MAFGPPICGNCGSTVEVVEHALYAGQPASPTFWVCRICRAGAEERQRVLARTLDLVLRYDELLLNLEECRSAKGEPWLKKMRTVLAVVGFLSADRALPEGFAPVALKLLDTEQSRLYHDAARGMIAAIVAVLRQAGMRNPEIEPWLAGEVVDRKLSFTASDAMRWFFNCNADKPTAPRSMVDAFKDCLPDPSQPMTEAEGKAEARRQLESVRLLSVAALSKPPRRKR